MRSSIALALAALSIASTSAQPNHAHRRLHNRAATVASILSDKAILQGQNSPTGSIRLGGGGDYEVEFTNDSDENELVLLVWNMAAGGSEYSGNAITSCSWCNGQAPAISVPLTKSTNGQNNSVTVSFDSGLSGGWGAAYSDTPSTMDVQGSGGQLPNTIQEFTFSPTGVVDTSREIYPQGHDVAAQGPECGTSTSECVFTCDDSDAACTYGYLLHNCAGPGQQGDNTQSGGCAAGQPGQSKWTVSFKN
ncbi:MAG: hypothetical protein Q9165_007927 [Trypethelium subeluteriae]